MKTWVLVVALIVLLGLLCAFVGMGSWHMAYDEATQRGILKQEKLLETSKIWCKELVGDLQQHHEEDLRYAKEICEKEINIGLLGLGVYGLQIVNEAISDVMIDSLSRSRFKVNASSLIKKPLSVQAADLLENSNVHVFVGPESADDLEELVTWARSRSINESLIVFITPAIIEDDSSLRRQESDNFAVIQMRIPAYLGIRATLNQISKQNVKNLLVLVKSPDDYLSNQIQLLSHLMKIETTLITSDKSSHSSKVIKDLEKHIDRLSGNVVTTTGLLITQNYMFGQLLSNNAKNSAVFRIPWFTTIDEVLYDSHLLQNGFIDKRVNLGYTLKLGNTAKNIEWNKNISKRIAASGLSSRDRDPKSTSLEYTFDSFLIATLLGPWVQKDVNLDSLANRIQVESSMWRGISGLLKFNNLFQRDSSPYLQLNLGQNLSSQVIQFPSGVWQIVE